MTDATPAWDGYPQNRERDGVHWLHHPEDLRPCVVPWDASIAAWCSGAAHSPRGIVELGYYYLGPCLLPAEVAALVEAARREEREVRAIIEQEPALAVAREVQQRRRDALAQMDDGEVSRRAHPTETCGGSDSCCQGPCKARY